MKTKGLVFDSERSLIEPDATVLHDRSRFGNDGAFLSDGHPDWVRLPFGLWVMSFDGTGDEVLTGSPVLVPNGFTAIAWWKRVGAAGGDVGVDYHTIFTAINGRNDYNGLSILSAGTTVHGDVKTDMGTYTSTVMAISAADWHMVGYKWDGSNINSIADGIVSANVAAPGTLDSGTTGLRMGRWLANNNYYLTNGYMVLHRIFNYALSATQIRKIFDAERDFFGV